MKCRIITYSSMFLLIFVTVALPGQLDWYWMNQMKPAIITDHTHFYSVGIGGKVAASLALAALLAHSQMDENFQQWYQRSIRNEQTDAIAKIVKPFGNGRITAPLYLVLTCVGQRGDHYRLTRTIGNWGNQSLRATIIGVPPVLILQRALGASRPDEDNGSHWHPFRDDNGVSGHSFMGAIPFLTAARMTTNKPLASAFYLCSTLTALSRINDHKHYLSQCILGWGLAFLSTSCVDPLPDTRVSVYPELTPYGANMRVTFNLN